jgi:nitrite reductase (cytochrome c-552)
MMGFEVVCGIDYPSARKLVTHPVTCNDCHEPKSMQLRVTRPGLLNALDALAKSGKDIAPLPSLTRHRVENEARKKESRPIKSYNPNTQASRQEMRSLVCAQCHVEYYFKKEGKLVTFPWHNGLKMEEIEEYYDQTVKHVDWKHPDSGAEVLKAQHPEFELWSQGIHARSGVSCADCHMPYKREGAVKISDHHVRSPLLNIAGACQTCHRSSEKEILERAEASQERTKKLMTSAEYAVVDLINEIKSAEGGDAEMLENARKKQRQAQWRLDFVAAENSMGFHAPQESARILAEALDLARQGQLQAYKAKPGAQKR